MICLGVILRSVVKKYSSRRMSVQSWTETQRAETKPSPPLYHLPDGRYGHISAAAAVPSHMEHKQRHPLPPAPTSSILVFFPLSTSRFTGA